MNRTHLVLALGLLLPFAAVAAASDRLAELENCDIDCPGGTIHFVGSCDDFMYDGYTHNEYCAIWGRHVDNTAASDSGTASEPSPSNTDESHQTPDVARLSAGDTQSNASGYGRR
jgi:hypothetical protein